MRRIRFIAGIAIIMVALIPVSAAASDYRNDNDDGVTYGSYHRHNLIDVPERRAGSSVSELGGWMTTGLFSDARIHWRLTDRRFDFTERELRNTNFSLTGRTTTGWIGLQAPLAGGRAVLDVQSGLSSPETNRARALYDLHLTATPVELAAIDIRVGRRSRVLDLDGVFWGEALTLNIPTAWSYSQFEGRIRILSGLTVHLGYRDMGMKEPNPDRSLEFSSAASGAAEFRYHGISIGQEDGAFAQFTSHQLDITGKLNLFSEGTQFGQISNLDADIDWYRLVCRPPIVARRLELTLDYLSGSGQAAGHIKGWPFTDPLEDLLGLRRNFKATADIELWRLSGVTAFQPFVNWNVTTQVDVYRLRPNLLFADWMPTFLVFGVQDMDRYRDDYDRIDFGRFQLEISRAFGRLMIGGHISQLLPIEIKRLPSTEGSGYVQPGRTAAAPSPDTVRREGGGRSIHIWIGYRM